MRKLTLLLSACLGITVAGSASATPVLMSAEWTVAACKAWNEDALLTKELVTSDWIRNDKGRGFKVMQIYRSDCPEVKRAEMRVSLVDGQARCVYGGSVETAKLDSGADYVMWAETARWKEMGAGEYGPMKAMMFGRLNFDGPKMEAMGNMGPFGNFLLLVGKVPSDMSACPAK